MMNYQYLLGIDVGTSSTKVAVLEKGGSLVGIERCENSLLSPLEGWAELSITDIWAGVLTALKRLLENTGIDSKSIKAIGISCLCPGLMAFGQDGAPLINPIIFMDRRSGREVEEIKASISEEELSKISGNKLMPGACSLTSMLWIKNNRREIYNKTRYFGHINTFFVHKLTGEFGIDGTNASYTGLFETGGSLGWNEEAALKTGIDIEKLPPVKASDSIAGLLTCEEFIGLGIERGIPVAMGGADTACSALAIGVTEHNQVFESVGTTNVITVCSQKPVFDVRFMNRCHVIKDRWLYHGAMSSAGASLKWFRDQFCENLTEAEKTTGANAYGEMDKMVNASQPGANGTVFLPYMSGERTPVWDPDAKGVFFGLSLRTKKADLIRAILEGAGYGIKQIFEIAEKMTDEEINEFMAIGGGAKSLVWGQIKADITGKTIHVLDMNDAAVIGAIMLAGLAAGIYESPEEALSYINRDVYSIINPQEENKEAYNKNYNKYIQLYPRLKDLYKD